MTALLAPEASVRLPSTMYLSGCSNPPTVAAAATTPRLGLLAQPGNALHRQGPSFTGWGVDNGAFGKAMRGKPWTDGDTGDYLVYLQKVRDEVDISKVLFATAPDVLWFENGGPRGDAHQTWRRSREVFPFIRALGFPAALVAQNGILDAPPYSPAQWDEFDVLFLGGDDTFKLGDEGRFITAEAKRRGKWVHMGRVNSCKRLRYAQSIGCDSADGTFIGFGPLKNLPKVLRWLEATEETLAA